MISKRRYRRMLPALDCRGLPPHARGPPQWAGAHEGHSGQFTRPVIRSRASAVAPPAPAETRLIPTIHTKGMA
jgi:hypothetical protein